MTLPNSSENGRDSSVNGSKATTELTRYARYKMRCRIKEEIAHLREELRCPYKLTNAEHAALRRAATATILAEDAMRRALEGLVPISDATRASSAARRMRRDLSKLIAPFAPAVHEDG
jgi:hypothetical protein